MAEWDDNELVGFCAEGWVHQKICEAIAQKNGWQDYDYGEDVENEDSDLETGLTHDARAILDALDALGLINHARAVELSEAELSQT